MIPSTIRKKCSIACTVALLFLTAPQNARAQMFISGLVGADFGGDSGCQTVTSCKDKKLNESVAIGSLGALLGFEEELAYAKNFFGTAPGLSSNVVTIMSNIMVSPKIGFVHPYGLVGLGLVKTHVEFTPIGVFATTSNNFGWDIGGGVIIFPIPHLGIRGDVRYYHALQDLKIGGFTVNQEKLDFGRVGAGIVLSF